MSVYDYFATHGMVFFQENRMDQGGAKTFEKMTPAGTGTKM